MLINIAMSAISCCRPTGGPKNQCVDQFVKSDVTTILLSTKWQKNLYLSTILHVDHFACRPNVLIPQNPKFGKKPRIFRQTSGSFGDLTKGFGRGICRKIGFLGGDPRNPIYFGVMAPQIPRNPYSNASFLLFLAKLIDFWSILIDFDRFLVKIVLIHPIFGFWPYFWPIVRQNARICKEKWGVQCLQMP